MVSFLKKNTRNNNNNNNNNRNRNGNDQNNMIQYNQNNMIQYNQNNIVQYNQNNIVQYNQNNIVQYNNQKKIIYIAIDKSQYTKKYFNYIKNVLIEIINCLYRDDYISVYIFDMELNIINNPMKQENINIQRYLNMLDTNNNSNLNGDIYSTIINIIDNIYHDNKYLQNRESNNLSYKIILLTSGINHSNYYRENIYNKLNEHYNINYELLICSFDKEPLRINHKRYHYYNYNNIQQLINYIQNRSN